MFNRKLKERIAELERENDRLHASQFRVGDKVYVQKEGYGPLEPVYLRKSFNGGHAYYFTDNIDDFIVEILLYTVAIDSISHTPPETCECCGHLIK